MVPFSKKFPHFRYFLAPSFTQFSPLGNFRGVWVNHHKEAIGDWDLFCGELRFSPFREGPRWRAWTRFQGPLFLPWNFPLVIAVCAPCCSLFFSGEGVSQLGLYFRGFPVPFGPFNPGGVSHFVLNLGGFFTVGCFQGADPGRGHQALRGLWERLCICACVTTGVGTLWWALFGQPLSLSFSSR